jgi:hypothetical protein
VRMTALPKPALAVLSGVLEREPGGVAGEAVLSHGEEEGLCVCVMRIPRPRLDRGPGMMRVPPPGNGGCMGRGLALCAGGGVDME